MFVPTSIFQMFKNITNYSEAKQKCWKNNESSFHLEIVQENKIFFNFFTFDDKISASYNTMQQNQTASPDSLKVCSRMFNLCYSDIVAAIWNVIKLLYSNYVVHKSWRIELSCLEQAAHKHKSCWRYTKHTEPGMMKNGFSLFPGVGWFLPNKGEIVCLFIDIYAGKPTFNFLNNKNYSYFFCFSFPYGTFLRSKPTYDTNNDKFL